MTRVYFVCHAQPEHNCIVVHNKRSMDIIIDTAAFFGKEIITDERLREREKGPHGNNHGMFQKRWADQDYHEEGGESVAMVQKRNMEALNEILSDNADKKQ